MNSQESLFILVLGKLPVPGRPTIWFTVGQGPTALVLGAGGGCLGIFTLIYPFSPLSPSLWETARYRLKYCLKGPLNPKLPTYLPFHLALYSAVLVELAKSIPVHSLILSSHLCCCLSLLLFPFTVSCRIVFAKPEDLET